MIMASICCAEGFQDRGTPDSSSQSVTSFSSCLRASSLALSSVAEIRPVSRRVSFGLTEIGGCCWGGARTSGGDGGGCRCSTSLEKPGGLEYAREPGGGAGWTGAAARGRSG